MKVTKSVLGRFKPGSAEHVVLHGTRQLRRGKKPSMAYGEIKNPRLALAQAALEIELRRVGQHMRAAEKIVREEMAATGKRLKEKAMTMSKRSIIVTMAVDNPGAMTVLLSIFQTTGVVTDARGRAFGLYFISVLDRLEIYAERIWQLFNDVCERNLNSMFDILWAWDHGELNGVTKETVDHAIANWGEGLDLEQIQQAVATAMS